MKKYIIIITLIIYFQPLFSWDSTTAKFFPLNVGNKWIYEHYWYWSGYSRLDVRVMDTLITNGHKYYKLRSKIQPPGNGYSERFVRLDSATGSIRYYETSYPCQWLVNEVNGDSLACHWPDSCRTGCGCCIKATRDTTILILGQMHLSKGYHWGSFETSDGRGYAADIGLYVEYHYGTAGTSWRKDLKGCVINGIVIGDTNLTGIIKITSEIPENFSLFQNYPNPFNPATHLRFEISELRFVIIKIYDILGKEIQTLVNEKLSPGTYEVEFDGTNYASGVYFYTLSSGNYLLTKKMVLLK